MTESFDRESALAAYWQHKRRRTTVLESSLKICLIIWADMDVFLDSPQGHGSTAALDWSSRLTPIFRAVPNNSFLYCFSLFLMVATCEYIRPDWR